MNRQVVSIANNYRHLIEAVVNQAVKDNAIWFLESDVYRGYCAAAGINPAGLKKALLSSAPQHERRV
jgi:hypothetical protein